MECDLAHGREYDEKRCDCVGAIVDLLSNMTLPVLFTDPGVAGIGQKHLIPALPSVPPEIGDVQKIRNEEVTNLCSSCEA